MNECVPTDGPTNPLNRLKERAKTLFKSEEDNEDNDDENNDDDDDEFSDARDGTENGGEVVDDEVYHEALEKY